MSGFILRCLNQLHTIYLVMLETENASFSVTNESSLADHYFVSVLLKRIRLSSTQTIHLHLLHLLQISINPEFKVSEISFDNNAAVCFLYYNAVSARVWNCTLTRP